MWRNPSRATQAEDRRDILIHKSPAQREEWMRDRVTRMFPGAEVTAIQIANVDDATQPLNVKYHLEAPRYAQVTGKRILFEENAFRRGQASPFSASGRHYAVEFPFAWRELDEIHIGIPAGFDFENPEGTGNLDFGAPGSYKLRLQIVRGATTELVVTRDLTFGSKGNVLFPVAAYASLKSAFDKVQLRDTHQMALKQN